MYLKWFILGWSLTSLASFNSLANDQLSGKMSSFKGSELCTVANNTLTYLNRGNEFDPQAIHGGKLNTHTFQVEQVKATLEFICQTYREDVRAGRPSRLHDTQFINEHFELVKWQPDLALAHKIAEKTKNPNKRNLLARIPQDKILLTKYYTKLVDAQFEPSADYNQAIYQLPYDEQDLTPEQAEQKKAQLTRFKLTRQQIMQGALDKDKLAKPLLWLTPAGLHDVMLQGTAVVKHNDKTEYYNVHRNNGIAYDYALDKDQQSRYWYFKKVPGILGYGKEPEDKIQIIPQVTVAGNVKQLGLGKLILLSYPNQQGELINRLVILADQGGAFDNNNFQLDLLTDSYYGWRDYHAANKHLPDFVNATVLLKK
ncbi:MltA domain-containing protein [Catenovulum sp. 2E275]|uniref:MltA domain-containing protein n=1 Tax=Catenovulum sp. 2E275 TaxID=2980497 RepID=UPI0021D341D8|nr:MltA domain-containing protein [Catenovulum sp. 2E275]MCU4677143.1 MltA domain-containing protein [Catenovulum sp. 2E275]